MKQKIFVYGTLLDEQTREQVYGYKGSIRTVTLKGYKRDGLNIIKRKGSTVEGGVLEVNKLERIYLDLYEGLGNLYKTIEVEPEGEKMIAYQLM